MRNFLGIAAVALALTSCDPPTPPGKAELTALPNPVQFGQVDLGSTAMKTVTINNISGVEVNLVSSVNSAAIFGVPTQRIFIAARGSATATVRFTPNRVAAITDEWVLAVEGDAPLLRLSLRGEGITPCNDMDSDGFTSGCVAATDCDDTNRLVHPGAREICNGGVDDDCDPLTVETCVPDGGQDAGFDAGVPDAGQVDAGPCTCVDDPNDCRGVNACVKDGGANVCTPFDLPNTTSCVRTAADGGSGVCLSATCIECISASDCLVLNANATVCDLVACNSGRCESQRRHDSTAWRVTPTLSQEILVNGSATPLKAMWDGQNFAIAMITLDGGAVVRRVSRTGVIVDAVGYRLNPRVKDIAFSGDRFLQVTEENAGGGQTFNYIAGSYFSYDGGANTTSQPIISDPGNATHPVGHFDSPSVAGSSQGSFMVIAASSQYAWSKWAKVPSGGGGEITTPWQPRDPVLTGSANGYSLATQENLISGGNAEVGGAFFGRSGGDLAYAVVAPFTAADVIRNGECCTISSRLATNGSTFMLAYTWGGLAALYRPYDANLQPMDLPSQYPLGGATYVTAQTIELGSDGVNFLISQQASGATLRMFRVTPIGDQLDTPTFDVSSNDTNIESKPRFASDGLGRNILAYQKVENSQTNAYVRLFSTCP